MDQTNSMNDHVEYDPTLLRPYRSLLHPVVELLHQVQHEVGSEPVPVEHDLPSQPEVLDLLDVAQHLVRYFSFFFTQIYLPYL